MFRVIATQMFGEFSRYKLTLAIDRFGNPCAFVEDAEVTDELTGLPTIVAQA